MRQPSQAACILLGALMLAGSARAVITNHDRRRLPEPGIRIGLNVSSSYRGFYLNYNF